MHVIIENKTDILMKSLTEFYNRDNFVCINKIRSIIESKSDMSLRLLDWFVTNYSKKHSIILGDKFDVYQNYKLQLKSYSKKQFDPFCRKQKIVFYYDNDESFIETSCGQLCFFRWCFQNNILDYIKLHINQIETDMKLSLVKNNSLQKKRQPLSLSASRSILQRNVKYNVSFS